MPSFIENHAQWWVAGAIVFLGLVVYGFGDLMRFSFKRAWAISRVAFSESIRRRVLWITPLAILGVVVVTQLQKPFDEQDAIRQTIKFALFASGLLVTVTAIILACTNLPKDIDTRVIYTIVTKPTTRLEIVVGKIIGFAKVSATILLIMGLFTYGYLHLRAYGMRRDIAARLEAGTIDPLSKSTYEYWAREGLLTAKSLRNAQDLQIFAKLPTTGDSLRWFYGSGEGDVIVPFRLSEDDLRPAGIPGAPPGATGVVVRIEVGFARSLYKDPAGEQSDSALPVGVAAPRAEQPPQINVQILDQNLNTLIDPRTINQGAPIPLSDPSGQEPVGYVIPGEAALNLARVPYFFVSISGGASGLEYSIDTRSDPADPLSNAVSVIVPGGPPGTDRVIAPMVPPAATDGRPASPIVRARTGNYGQQLRGGPPDRSPVAVFPFRGVAPRAARDGSVGFELRVGIESSGAETEDNTEATHVEVSVADGKGGTTAPVVIYPETNRTCYFDLPASAVAGGSFDVVVRNFTPGHYVGLQRTSLAMVASQEGFNFNLFKSLTVLWLLSLLVVIISIFCSTFLSWPIAIVLTVVMLLGNWLVVQLSDTLVSGIGNQVANDIFGSNNASASQAKVVSTAVEALTKLLNNVAKVLPDIGQFSAIEQIERGMTIPFSQLLGPLQVLATFGIPMMVLAYVFLRNKEVAP